MNNHKSSDRLIVAYQNAGWISPKFGKLMARPKVTLSKAGFFDEIVTLDLKEFGFKYILWCKDRFMRFVQVKLIPNKKADAIV